MESIRQPQDPNQQPSDHRPNPQNHTLPPIHLQQKAHVFRHIQTWEVTQLRSNRMFCHTGSCYELIPHNREQNLQDDSENDEWRGATLG